ncbi:DUF411 domain-containing protein [Marivita sp. XM-24bin2]|jgi:hypothetical protein|uniref:DUF411 domain-containing protein n=1 Tax=unclassified Marivita TaxID=2632480 RepID=UPI000D797113|nr:DUF411 domain-containing protein [Marivita sp. XM-24bin2]MCR9107596.1 DUF411 domain-containing protein [Paracoccaceae bacterium]PWL34861.1 MAG: metal-binding protein [Marivita sp. XM-24bin2]
MKLHSRRSFLIGAAALTAAPKSLTAQSMPEMHVFKDPNCGCCSAWIEILERDGFRVTTEARSSGALVQEKVKRGIPAEMASCHTADVDGYVIEGHVPARDVRKLLAARPDAIGLAVPGMPLGSPGMGPEHQREAYDVHLILRNGSTEIFTRYEAAA